MMGSSKERALSASQRLLLVAVGLSSLMASIQGSALNAILPFVARSFEVDLPTIQWVWSAHSRLSWYDPSRWRYLLVQPPGISAFSERNRPKAGIGRDGPWVL